MPREARKYLFDVQRAVDRITRFCQGKQFNDYQSDDLLRSAVERQFEIIGEALSMKRKATESHVARSSARLENTLVAYPYSK